MPAYKLLINNREIALNNDGTAVNASDLTFRFDENIISHQVIS